jgi:hypothetical protein
MFLNIKIKVEYLERECMVCQNFGWEKFTVFDE